MTTNKSYTGNEGNSDAMLGRVRALGRGRVRELTLAEAVLEAERDSFYNASSRKMDDRWSGESFDNAVRMAVEGWPKGTAKLRKRLHGMPSIHEAKRPRPRWDVQGSQVDIGRFMAGTPESMVEVVRTRRASQVIKIGIERAVSAMTSVSDIEAVGASVLAVIENLRTAGIPAEVWCLFTVVPTGDYSKRDQFNSTQILIQEAGRPVNLDVLAYWTVNASAFRRLVFSIEEHESPAFRKKMGYVPSGGYGAPSNVADHVTPEEHGFDEIAPAREYEVTPWIQEVLARRV